MRFSTFYWHFAAHRRCQERGDGPARPRVVVAQAAHLGGVTGSHVFVTERVYDAPRISIRCMHAAGRSRDVVAPCDLQLRDVDACRPEILVCVFSHIILSCITPLSCFPQEVTPLRFKSSTPCKPGSKRMFVWNARGRASFQVEAVHTMQSWTSCSQLCPRKRSPAMHASQRLWPTQERKWSTQERR